MTFLNPSTTLLHPHHFNYDTTTNATPNHQAGQAVHLLRNNALLHPAKVHR